MACDSTMGEARILSLAPAPHLGSEDGESPQTTLSQLGIHMESYTPSLRPQGAAQPLKQPVNSSISEHLMGSQAKNRASPPRHRWHLGPDDSLWGLSCALSGAEQRLLAPTPAQEYPPQL